MTTQELIICYIFSIPNYNKYYTYVSHELKCDTIYVKTESFDGYYKEIIPIDLLDYITFVKNLEL